MSTAIVWLRRDLRLHDHPALTRALAAHERVVPLFVLDDTLLAVSPARSDFLLGCLADLRAALSARGGGLVVRRGRAVDVVPAVARACGAQAVLWTSEPTPYALRRDRAVAAALGEAGIAVVREPGAFCADIGVPRTAGGKPFTVFTPFWRVQAALPRREVLAAPDHLPPLPDGVEAGELPAPERPPRLAPGERAARVALDAWLDGPVGSYADRHDVLAGGTSRLSPYLRFGCLSAREVEARAGACGGPGADAFVRQLAWRDFHAHVLLHHPESLDLELQPAMRELEWDDDAELLEAWRAGRTGYPLVDAGMRQLAATGWMHNRARLVVGSFLTKDLHLDWRAGERHFRELLLDGEPAQNVGNWQWVASTGVDPAPAFKRLFNPTRQQARFDPDGTYVRRWVPELAGVPDARLAEPWRMSAAERAAAGAQDYPAPVVDHAAERHRALERYRAVRGTR